MPNRIIKESICTSDSIDGLGWFEEVFFYRLIVNVDDYGRFDARPAILKARLFPLKDITIKQVENALIKLSTAGMVLVYTYDCKPFLQLCAWSKHQQIRNHKSKFPEPAKECSETQSGDIENKELKSVEINHNQLKPVAPVIQSNPNTNPKRNPESNTRENALGVCDDRFERFWIAYPRKKNKGAAEKSFEKLKPSETLLETMLTALEKGKQTRDWQRENGQFIPYPATWLNARGWEDEYVIDDEENVVESRFAHLLVEE